MTLLSNTRAIRRMTGLALVAGGLIATEAEAQYAVTWSNVDGSGTTVDSTGGTYAIAGICGQWDAGAQSGGGSSVVGGFWAILNSSVTCYANCDGSTSAPVLGVADFVCFLGRFRAGDPYANCDGSTSPPTLGVADFVCFLAKFRAGCP
jgi:hypothetical protein